MHNFKTQFCCCFLTVDKVPFITSIFSFLRWTDIRNKWDKVCKSTYLHKITTKSWIDVDVLKVWMVILMNMCKISAHLHAMFWGESIIWIFKGENSSFVIVLLLKWIVFQKVMVCDLCPEDWQLEVKWIPRCWRFWFSASLIHHRASGPVN